MEQIQTATESLPGFFSLANETIQWYKRKWQTLLKIVIASYAFGFVAALLVAAEIAVIGGISLFSGNLMAGIVAGIMAAIIDIVLFGSIGSWFAAATIVVLRDNRETFGLGQAMRRSKRYAFPLFWVMILAGLAIFWGWIFFIIPGIVFTIWFLFSRYCVVIDNEKGAAAISKSREYVRGYFWKIFLLGLLGTITIFIVYGILDAIARLPLGNLLYIAATVAIAPIPAIYLYLIFDHLKKIKGGSPMPVSKPQKTLVSSLAAVGLIVAIALAGLLVYFAPQIKNLYETARQQCQTQTGKQLPDFPQNPQGPI